MRVLPLNVPLFSRIWTGANSLPRWLDSLTGEYQSVDGSIRKRDLFAARMSAIVAGLSSRRIGTNSTQEIRFISKETAKRTMVGPCDYFGNINPHISTFHMNSDSVGNLYSVHISAQTGVPRFVEVKNQSSKTKLSNPHSLVHDRHYVTLEGRWLSGKTTNTLEKQELVGLPGYDALAKASLFPDPGVFTLESWLPGRHEGTGVHSGVNPRAMAQEESVASSGQGGASSAASAASAAIEFKHVVEPELGEGEEIAQVRLPDLSSFKANLVKNDQGWRLPALKQV
jgi:hypothetical protein